MTPEVEVTTAMIAAGLELLIAYNPRDTSEEEQRELLTGIYRAMHLARNRSAR